MALQVIGAGLPRTATKSLSIALEQLLGGPCYHMRVIPGHPFDLGEGWRTALQGGTPDWDTIYNGYTAAVDWPTSAFWFELSQIYPNALIILSVRDSAQQWYESMNATVLHVARKALAPDWSEGRDLLDLLERFTGQAQWDDAETLMKSYERHNAQVRTGVAAHRLLEWNAKEGWEPLCRALGKPVPDEPFPWTNKKEEWR